MTNSALEQTLQQAISSHRAGDFSQAEQLYRSILQVQPANSDANHNLGVLFIATNKPDVALPFFKKALENNPNQTQFWLSYIDTLMKLERFESASMILKQGRENYGLQGEKVDLLVERLSKIESTENTKKPTKKSLDKKNKNRKEPSEDEINLFISLSNQKHYAKAEKFARDLTKRFPNHIFGWRALGDALQELEKLDNALEARKKVVKLSPNDADAFYNLGVVLDKLERFAEAETSYLQAIRLKPNYASTHNNLGSVLKKQGKLAEAEKAYRAAFAIKPDYAKGYNNLADVLSEQGKLVAAESYSRMALEIDPNYGNAHYCLGNILKERGKLAEAEVCFQRALEIKPDNAAYYCGYAGTLNELGRLEEAETHYHKALEIEPDSLDANGNLLYAYNHTVFHSQEFRLTKAKRYGEIVTKKATKKFTNWKIEQQPKRLRVGFVSGDFCGHPVGFFLENVLRGLQDSNCDIIAYSTHHRIDEVTERIKPYFHEWRLIFGLSDKDAVKLIHNDGIHILIDLSGHTKFNRLPLFAWKPAPIQVTWLGYFATTGVAEMDYILVDEAGVPESNQWHFTEKVSYLPDSRLCFSTPKYDIPVMPLPALANGFITIGCFQHLSRVTDEVLELWGRIFAQLPTARIRFQSPQLKDSQFVEEFHLRLASCGIDSNRISTHGASIREEYLAAHSEIDLILDTFPYTGGTKTCEALWMGVPTLTLAGETLLARQGASLLSAAGLNDWVVNDKETYFTKAVHFANDIPALANLRQNLREQVLISPIFNSKRFAENFENTLWKMWRDYSQN